MSLSLSRSGMAALLAFAAGALSTAVAFAQYAQPYDPLKAGEDAYSYAETRRRFDIRRQIEWNDESRLRQGIPPLFDNTVSYVPLTVASGYSDSYPLAPAGPGVGGYGYGPGAGGYGYGPGVGGYGPGVGGYGNGGGVGYGVPSSLGGNGQANGPYGYGNGYNTYGYGAPYPVTTPYPNAPVSRASRWNDAARRLLGLPPKAHNDRAYLSMFPYYSPVAQPIGSKTEQSGPDSYQTLPVYAPSKLPAAGPSAPALPSAAPARSVPAPTGREF